MLKIMWTNFLVQGLGVRGLGSADGPGSSELIKGVLNMGFISYQKGS